MTTVVAAAVSLSPVRWDLETLGLVVPNAPRDLRLSDRRILYVSADNDWRNAHLADYGLDFLTFPNGVSSWMCFREGIAAGGPRPELAIDSDGEIERRAGRGWRPLTREEARDLEARLVLVPSAGTRAALAARWPVAAARDARVIQPAGGRPFLEGPRVRVSAGQTARLFLALLLPVSALLWTRARRRRRGSASFLDAALVVPLVLAGHATVTYLLGFLTGHSVAWALVGEVGVAVGFALAAGREVGSGGSTAAVPERVGGTLRRVSPWLLAGALFGLVVVFRLDFDGDLYTHWLPMARMHHLLGRHDPGLLVARYGVAHEATYPPGFPIVISTLLWIAGVPRTGSLGFGEASNFAILLYRGLMAVVSLSFLAGVAATFRSMRERGERGWLLPVAIIPLALPLFLGEPRSAEVFFTPMLGFAMLALLAGRALSREAYVRLGLALAIFGLFVKNDAIMVLPLIVAPWYLLDRRPGRTVVWDVVVVLLAGLPVLFWRLDLSRVVERTNFMFRPVGIADVFSGFGDWPRLLAASLEFLLRSPGGAIIVVVLPVAVIFRLLQDGIRRDLIIPLGIWTYTIGTTYIFTFSKSDPLQHLNRAYGRLMTHAVLSGVLYASWVVLTRYRTRVETTDSTPG